MEGSEERVEDGAEGGREGGKEGGKEGGSWCTERDRGARVCRWRLCVVLLASMGVVSCFPAQWAAMGTIPGA
jgi:hypothetical protein